jgi:DNA-binding NarL/FixJ family response regulator
LLVDVGLVATLEWYCEAHAIPLTIHSTLPRYEAMLEQAIYRLVQHANAHEVSLWEDNQSLHLQVRVKTKPGETSLLLMQEYTRMAGGTLDIQFEEQIIIYAVFHEVERITPPLHDAPVAAVPNNARCYLIVMEDIVLGSTLQQYLQEKQPGCTVVVMDRLRTEQVLRLKPTLVLLDQLDAIDGTVPVLFLSAYDSPAYLHRLFEAGVQGVVLKRSLLKDLLPAINVLESEERYVSPDAHFDLATLAPHTPVSFDPTTILTTRELEILERILQDKTHLEIADALGISYRTVEKHRANLMQKLGLKSHTELILFAVRHELFDTPAV